VGAVLLLAHPASAFKWHSCPVPPVPVYPSTVGATTAPFIHPGHALTIVLNQEEAAFTGGFSLVPDGNTVNIVFRSLFGAPLALAPRTASATTSAALTFVFPDTARELGKLLAGPVEIQVFAGAQRVALIAAADLVALPPANDVTGLVENLSEQVVLATLSADGDVWIPARFRGDPMEMPGCEGSFIMPVPVFVSGADIVGDKPTAFSPLDRIRGVLGYLGDMVINDTNFYGMLFPQPIRMQQVGGTVGVSLCRLNDAVDLVLRVLGDPSWVQSKVSPFSIAAADSSAIPLRLEPAPYIPGLDAIAATPGNRSSGFVTLLQRDSFGNDCTAQLTP
jgi:hypothetical protein